jgi:hypothetical protein
MSNEIKTYQIHFSVMAKDIKEAINKAKLFLEISPDKAIREIGDKEKYQFHKVN